MSLSADLLTRAKAGLSNPAEVIKKHADKAIAEAIEIIGQKDIANAEKIDLGYFRLMLIMGLEFSELDRQAYDKLLSRIDKASTVKIEDGKTQKHTQKALVEQIENVYK